LIVAGSQGSKLDPSADRGVGAKMGLDATIPVDAPEMTFKRISVPGQSTVDLSKIIASNMDWRQALG
jgi:2,5-furandicarboxylate decarboxylase 1